jgi:hypothetical protein
MLNKSKRAELLPLPKAETTMPAPMVKQSLSSPLKVRTSLFAFAFLHTHTTHPAPMVKHSLSSPLEVLIIIICLNMHHCTHIPQSLLLWSILSCFECRFKQNNIHKNTYRKLFHILLSARPSVTARWQAETLQVCWLLLKRAKERWLMPRYVYVCVRYECTHACMYMVGLLAAAEESERALANAKVCPCMYACVFVRMTVPMRHVCILRVIWLLLKRAKERWHIQM